MMTFYLIIIIALFVLAISDLVVGVSNDAVNFLNSAVGAKAATWKWILVVAALGVIVGCTFSSGMMEVARKGIFHPEHFYFSEIILLFLAVMVTDVILLDAFNTFGMPTSTTVSIVFELLGAAVAISIIKIYTSPEGLGMGEYINSAKALLIISGILLSVVVAFSAGVIVQYLTRLIFSFNYEKRFKYIGSIWGGLAIAAITYFMLVKGAKGTSFMDDTTKTAIKENTFMIIGLSFVAWTIILQLIILFTKIDVLKVIVLIGTFALAMAFAGNDLVNFIGVPLAGYNSYELFRASGGAADELLMTGLAGKVPTPTLLLLIAGVIMTITLWTSKKARTVVQTSLDLGRQYEGSERFASYAVSRSLVRNFAKTAIFINKVMPKRVLKTVENQFDERPFIAKQAHLGQDAPAFDMIRAAVTLVVASILISVGTNLKLPLSTTYVTFMVFMGTSLADGAWGRESAVYRVSGVISVIGGWFFTAFSAFTIAFIFANIFYWGGPIAIGLVLLVAVVILYRTHRYHQERLDEQVEYEKSLEAGTLTKTAVIDRSAKHLEKLVGRLNSIIDDTLIGLENEDLAKLNKTFKALKDLNKKTSRLKHKATNALDKISDDELETSHFYIIIVDYINEMTVHGSQIVKPSLDHVDNNHKPLLADQIEELKSVHVFLKNRLKSTLEIFRNLDREGAIKMMDDSDQVVKTIRTTRKTQIKRIKEHKTGTRNSLLYLNHLGEFRNLGLYSIRIVRVFYDLILSEDEEPSGKKIVKGIEKEIELRKITDSNGDGTDIPESKDPGVTDPGDPDKT